MIDTVRIGLDCEIHSFGKAPRQGVNTIDEGSGLRVNRRGKSITAVEVSLPRLLFKDNKRLITGQRQIDKALDKVRRMLLQVAKPPINGIRFTRVDLVWHFLTQSPFEFLLAHRLCRHPEAQTEILEHRTGGGALDQIAWKGDRIRIQMYDKRSSVPGRKVVRVEAQLRGKRLEGKLAEGQPLERLEFWRCYKCFRTLITKFMPKITPSIRSRIAKRSRATFDKDELLYFAEKMGVDVIGYAVSRDAHYKTVKRLREKLAAYAFQELKIDWEKLLPAHRLPPIYHADILCSPTIFKFQRKIGRFTFALP